MGKTKLIAPNWGEWGPPGKRIARLAAVRYLALIVVVAVSLVMVGGQTAVAASGALKVTPASQNVSAGSTFKVDIIQNADVATSGSQINLVFNPAVVQVVSLEPGPGYADALFLAGIAPQSTDEAIAEANSTGQLMHVSTFYLPGSNSVPPGDAVFLTINMRAKAGGTSELKLEQLNVNPVSGEVGSPIEMIDEAGAKIEPTVTNGSVTVAGGAPGETAPPDGSVTPTATPKKSRTPRATVNGVVSPAGTLRIGALATGGSGGLGGSDGESGQLSVAIGGTIEVPLTLETSIDVTGVEFDLHFDPDAVQLDAVEPGEDWEDGNVSVRSEEGGASSLEDAIAEANDSGELIGLGVLLGPTDDPIEAGETTVLNLAFTAGDKDATSDLEFENVTLFDADLEDFPGEFENGQIIVGEGGSDGGGAGMLIFLLLGGVLVAGAGGAVAFMTRSRWSQSV